MARKFKTYVTSVGFFELAIAAPSMKAALEAWGAAQNFFHQGFAEETDDPKIIAAATAHPGVVLKRGVGTTGEFKENAELPKSLPATAAPRWARPKAKETKSKTPPKPKLSKQAKHAQILSFEKAQAKRERQRRKEDAEQEKREAAEALGVEKRQKATDKAQAILDRARERHEKRMAEIEKERLAAERKADSEKARWEREKDDLEDKVRKAKR